MNTQKQEVLKYLKGGEHLTSASSVTTLHITDLRARVSELRAEGYPIEDIWIKRRSKLTGRLVRYKLYYLDF